MKKERERERDIEREEKERDIKREREREREKGEAEPHQNTQLYAGAWLVGAKQSRTWPPLSNTWTCGLA